MTKSQKAIKLQIKPLDESTVSPTENRSAADPRVEAFLARLRTKAEEIDTEVHENHVEVKAPRRRRITEQPANPDWYQPVDTKTSAPKASRGKRFASAGSYPGRRAKSS